MYLRWIGAAMIVAAGGGFGLFLVREHRREESALEELLRILDLMVSEIQFRRTPLPQLCKIVVRQGKGILVPIFSALAEALTDHTYPNGAACMDFALDKADAVPRYVYRNLKILGQTLGQFDADGQVRSLEAVKVLCQRDLAFLQADRDNHLRSYRTLGICAGIALVIVLI